MWTLVLIALFTIIFDFSVISRILLLFRRACCEFLDFTAGTTHEVNVINKTHIEDEYASARDGGVTVSCIIFTSKRLTVTGEGRQP
ncbi:hypothetical protein DPMN_140922 [Dreissena polymorpha]|uniref:Uncharacterized protein n=1 Tax=Dreissena polymorpha TaxID=45954 RepID=A0A9D4GBT5_DREPO|nr:hypothetical protein DPMN_140922 [Dreissena polymorpha]